MKLFDQTFPATGSPGRAQRRIDGPRPELIVDLSRLLARLLHTTPTGVDRVEMAYARGLIAQASERLSFAAIHPSGIYGRLNGPDVHAFLDHTAERWEAKGVHESRAERYASATRWFWRLTPRPVPRRTAPRVLIQPSPNGLTRPGRTAAKVAREQCKFVCLVHDLIPITHPEYAKPGGSALHQRRLQTIESQAHGVLVNSQATLDAFLRNAGPGVAGKPVRLAPLGVERPRSIKSSPRADRPYFVIVGTIEPRKNHLLLLHIWRDLCERLGPARTPRLLIIGRRGWENENIVDMLERCEALRDIVCELGCIPDAERQSLLAGAQALLMPSFVEGFGLPVAEALAMGVPVIASDIIAHREVGGGVPDYLDPMNGPAWREAILAYAGPDGERRRQQLARLPQWSPATWTDHIQAVLTLADEVAAC